LEASFRFPLLRHLAETLPESLGCPAPLAGLNLAAILHLFPDLVAFTDAAIRLGLDPAGSTFYHKDFAGYAYPGREAVGGALRTRGAAVRPLTELDVEALPDSQPLLLVEDGGYIYPALHRKSPGAASRVIGAVEQTTRGRTNLALALGLPPGQAATERKLERALRFPVISVPDCRLKALIEPPLIARAVVEHLRSLTGRLRPGVPAAVLGGGAIGAGLVEELLKARVRVVAYDPAPETRLVLAEKGVTLASSPAEAVRGALFVIGASGRRSVTPDVIANLAHDTFLVSASSERHEIDADYLRAVALATAPLPLLTGVPAGTQARAGTTYRLPGRGAGGRDIHLIADGYPVNFWGFDSLPEPHADLVMSLVLLGAAALGAWNHAGRRHRREAFRPGWNRTAINQLVARSGLVEEFIRLHHPHATTGGAS
jgi:hypothetical protein